MQSVSFKIWIRVAVSISYDDNHYTTGTSLISLLRLCSTDLSSLLLLLLLLQNTYIFKIEELYIINCISWPMRLLCRCVSLILLGRRSPGDDRGLCKNTDATTRHIRLFGRTFTMTSYFGIGYVRCEPVVSGKVSAQWSLVGSPVAEITVYTADETAV